MLLQSGAKVLERLYHNIRGLALQYINLGVLGEVVHEENEVSRAIESDTL